MREVSIRIFLFPCSRRSAGRGEGMDIASSRFMIHSLFDNAHHWTDNPHHFVLSLDAYLASEPLKVAYVWYLFLLESKLSEGQLSIAALLQLIRVSVFWDFSFSAAFSPFCPSFHVINLLSALSFLSPPVTNKGCYLSCLETDSACEVKKKKSLAACDGYCSARFVAYPGFCHFKEQFTAIEQRDSLL